MKRCISCEQVKENALFGRNRAASDGLSVYCLQCNREKSRAYYRQRRASRGFALREPDTSPPGMKRCSQCRETLPLSAFHAHKTQSDGLNTYCKQCRSKQNRETHLKRTYGLDAADLAAMIEAQNGVCAICKRREPVHVDHDHLLGAVRGVLCFPCNVALGQLQDDIELFRNAIDYLERTTWQRTLVTTGVYQLTSPRPAPAVSPTS